MLPLLPRCSYANRILRTPPVPRITAPILGFARISSCNLRRSSSFNPIAFHSERKEGSSTKSRVIFDLPQIRIFIYSIPYLIGVVNTIHIDFTHKTRKGCGGTTSPPEIRGTSRTPSPTTAPPLVIPSVAEGSCEGCATRALGRRKAKRKKKEPPKRFFFY